MLDKEQLIQMKWNSNTNKHYIARGYTPGKPGTIGYVKIKDLTKGSSVYVKPICDCCGNTYSTTYNYYNKKTNKEIDVCSKCKGSKISKTLRKNNIDSIWKDIQICVAKKGYYLITSKEQYVSNKTYIYYECPIHGAVGSYWNNLKNNHGCKFCGRHATKNKRKHSTEEIKTLIESKNNNIWMNPDVDYVNAHTRNLQVLCGCCGKNIFVTCYNNYKKGQNRCENCSRAISIGEKIIKEWLDDKKITYMYQKSFKNLKDVGYLRYDFYLPDDNICIEFDGEQHFNTHLYDTWGKNNTRINLEYTQKHDEMKTQYCIDNNIKLLRINYKEQNHIEEILDKKIGIRYSLIS